jgi:uncharacterized RDD family membrane protein YckC
MTRFLSFRIKIAIIASLCSLAILLIIQLAGRIPAYLHILPASLGLVLFIFVVTFFWPQKSEDKEDQS